MDHGVGGKNGTGNNGTSTHGSTTNSSSDGATTTTNTTTAKAGYGTRGGVDPRQSAWLTESPYESQIRWMVAVFSFIIGVWLKFQWS